MRHPIGRRDEDDASPTFVWRVIAAHTATSLVAGLLASTLFDFASWWQTEWMRSYRPMDSPIVALGPALQVVRGVFFAVVLWPFREILLDGCRGALRLWLLLVGVGILSTYGPAPGSIEGWIYTALPPPYHLFGIPEVYGQALAFSLVLVGWYRRTARGVS